MMFGEKTCLNVGYRWVNVAMISMMVVMPIGFWAEELLWTMLKAPGPCYPV